MAGVNPGFQVRGAHLKKLRRAEGGAKNFGVFCVKNRDFTPKNHIFSILFLSYLSCLLKDSCTSVSISHIKYSCSFLSFPSHVTVISHTMFMYIHLLLLINIHIQNSHTLYGSKTLIHTIYNISPT
jgi:hypothetical protein